jgi:lipoic acid synthetase
MNFPMAARRSGPRRSAKCDASAGNEYRSAHSRFLRRLVALQKVLDEKPEILNHNIESVPRLYHKVRPQAKYRRSLELLQISKRQGLITKTGMMLGLGEEEHEIEAVLDDLVSIGCDILTLGQYLQPTHEHLPVARWVHPDEFAEWKLKGELRGIRHIEAGPLVRSSYHAEKQVTASRNT